MRRMMGLLAITVAAGTIAWMIPAAALASGGTTLWVSSATTVSGNGTSCADPGFNTIQSAINAAPASSTINVCAGTYTEQLQITHSVTINGLSNVIAQLPASPVDSTTPCDTAKGTGAYQPDQDEIAICGNIKVTLNDIAVDAAWPTTTCDDSLYGVLVAGGATLNFLHSAVTAAGAYPLNGCQGGIGLQVGMAWTKPVSVGHLQMGESSVSGYQKNGITVDGWKSTGAVVLSTVNGFGPTTAIAQNGIQVSNGAVVGLTQDTISGNECDDNAAPCGVNGLNDTQSTGIIYYGAGRGSQITDCTIIGNDIGLYYTASPAGAAVKKPQVLFSGDQFIDNRYEGASLDQGSANITKSSFTGGDVGIEVIQYAGQDGQTFGSFSVASYDTFSTISNATVYVLSDQAKGDEAGTFTITHSNIYAAKVRDNSKNLPIIHKFDTK